MIRCTKLLTDVTNKYEIEEIIKNQHEGKNQASRIEETKKMIRNIFYEPNQQKSIEN